MLTKLLDATDEALHSINELRLYRSERGFQGRFYCALQNALNKRNLLQGSVIIEMEYQKSSRHGTTQRPDIILHAPSEVTGAEVYDNNMAVWALKRDASPQDAKDDFNKLDIMFESLQYPVGIFINIDSQESRISLYSGRYRDRLYAASVRLINGIVEVGWSYR